MKTKTIRCLLGVLVLTVLSATAQTNTNRPSADRIREMLRANTNHTATVTATNDAPATAERPHRFRYNTNYLVMHLEEIDSIKAEETWPTNGGTAEQIKYVLERNEFVYRALDDCRTNQALKVTNRNTHEFTVWLGTNKWENTNRTSVKP